MDDVKKHRKMDKGKGRVSSRDESQSSSRKRLRPGRKMSDDQQPAAKKQKGTYCYQNMCITQCAIKIRTLKLQHCSYTASMYYARVSYRILKYRGGK